MAVAQPWQDTPAYLEDGAAVLRQRLAWYLSVAVPAVLAAVREARGFDAAQLPDPEVVDPYDRQYVDQAPALSIALTRASNYSAEDLGEDGGPEYRVSYSATVYAWYRSEAPAADGEVEENPAQRARDEYGQAVVAALLNTPSLGLAREVRVAPRSVVLTWGPPARLAGDRVMAAAAVAFDVTQVERLRRVTLGSAAQLDVTTTVVLDQPQQP